jgi:hypothetical protein
VPEEGLGGAAAGGAGAVDGGFSGPACPVGGGDRSGVCASCLGCADRAARSARPEPSLWTLAAAISAIATIPINVGPIRISALPRARQPPTSTRLRRSGSVPVMQARQRGSAAMISCKSMRETGRMGSFMHPFLNEILISLPQFSPRKHMAEQANLPRDALSLGHEIPRWENSDESNALERGVRPCRSGFEGMGGSNKYLSDDAGRTDEALSA